MRKMMQKKYFIVISIALLVAIWCGIKYHTTAATPSPQAVWVQAVSVQESSFPEEAHAVGTLVGRSVEITPEIAGHVEKIFFQDGQLVARGMPLLQLNDAVYKAKNESAKAKLAYSEGNFKRMSLLGRKGIVAQQAIDQAEADLKEKRADAEENAVILEKMKLVAPFEGILGKSKVNLGDYVTIGQSVVTLTDIKHLRIEYNVPEKFLPAVKQNQEVKVTTAAYPGKIFIGKVAFIAPTINTDNRSISLYAELSNENNLLKAGMFVDVVHALGNEGHVLMVPERSLVPILDGEQVYKIVDGKAYASTVVIGKRHDGKVQILQGLSRGDMVITDGQHKLKNGMPIKIKI